MSEKKRLRNYEELPLVLDVADIQQIMGISRTSAYELVRTPGFPAFRRVEEGSSRSVRKHSLTGWKKEPKMYRKRTFESKGVFPYCNVFRCKKAGQQVLILRKNVPKCDSKTKGDGTCRG